MALKGLLWLTYPFFPLDPLDPFFPFDPLDPFFPLDPFYPSYPFSLIKENDYATGMGTARGQTHDITKEARGTHGAVLSHCTPRRVRGSARLWHLR